MNRGIAIIWSGMLIATVTAVVPIAVTMLSKALDAARNIERYTAEALEGGVKIAGNTANVAALKDTISVATGLLAGAGSIKGHTGAIGAALAPAPEALPVPEAPILSVPGSNNGKGKGKGKGTGNGTGNVEEVQL